MGGAAGTPAHGLQGPLCPVKWGKGALWEGLQSPGRAWCPHQEAAVQLAPRFGGSGHPRREGAQGRPSPHVSQGWELGPSSL